NTVVANLRAGSVDTSFYTSIGFPQGKALEDAGWSGTVEYWRGNPRYIEFQMRDWGNTQRAAHDVRVRRALLHAIDRHAVAEGSIVIDYWKAVGAPTETLRLTSALLQDGEFRSKFPAASYSRRSLGYENLVYTTANISTPENRWSGSNRAGYSSPVLDEFLPRALSTIDVRAREPLYVEAFKAWTADAAVNVQHLQPRPVAYAPGLTGPKQTWVGETGIMWNPWEWAWK